MGDDKVVERTSAEVITKMKGVHEMASTLLDGIIDLFGQGAVSNRVAYCRGLAIERLEECLHRVNDGVQFALQATPDIREKMAEEALKKSATPGLQVVDGGKS